MYTYSRENILRYLRTFSKVLKPWKNYKNLFINFYLTICFWLSVLKKIHNQRNNIVYAILFIGIVKTKNFVHLFEYIHSARVKTVSSENGFVTVFSEVVFSIIKSNSLFGQLSFQMIVHSANMCRPIVPYCILICILSCSNLFFHL